ncbi:MAG TPA: ABC transporter permease subunit [Pilimelia sp.]|nr:ABC transporter permease subunit [Pilimelia sp.]
MNLVRAELARLTARRFVQAMVLVLLITFAITVATTIAGSHQPTSFEIAQAEQSAQQERRSIERYLAECRAAQSPDTPRSVRDNYPRNCAGINPADARPENHLWGVFVFEREIRPLVMLLAAFLALFGFLVAASFVGAEMTSGGMTNLLLWRPQRLAVLGTKLGSVLGAVLGVAVVSTVVYVAAFWVVGHTAGMPGHLSSREWGSLVLLGLRGLGLALVMTALGFAVATLGRHTAAALGVVAGYFVAWELGARVVMTVIDASRPERLMLSTYMAAWINGRVEMWDEFVCDSAAGGCGGPWVVTWWHAAVVFAALLLIFVGGAFVNFRRRDVA